MSTQHDVPTSAAPAPTRVTLPTATDRPVPLIVQQWAEAWNTADARGLAALMTEQGVYQDFAFQARNVGRDGVAHWLDLTVRSIPDTHVTVLDAFQVGDRAAAQWIFSGTPTGFGDLGGRSFSVLATSLFHLRDGKIQEVTDMYNRADLFHQLGLPSDHWVAPQP
ncbi:hypothetical protein GO986_10145 [Deinococcus sp. HMF7620]|uniref:Ester cyclase n=1 Tax=Deinococcus arboris TaxID=2682977 RepID=A0A7C9HRQ1_9DEIO|nr:ester cyclase [Deinococcus arboris]MVN87129.1 hypothetical protein [Deinococcus arboris]